MTSTIKIELNKIINRKQLHHHPKQMTEDKKIKLKEGKVEDLPEK
jgi:hypothetical protein